ncbi:mitochondria-eating protein-like isoform X5 [Mizuhopecten yessoensis]|uniref:mitochondria-eating protein-like isoform X5 n=1 Tax=Mizuhopecten yessoensis TaxID=6573 RepID=UPI000B45EA58|nr:mitochondria-eating protein-like isoform X5 [Mizuhopecten yessoensis]
MAESLRRLVNIGTFTVLQEKLERWLQNYYINTCDQNVARCCEIIELNAKVQGQLFKLLSVTAEAGGMYGGSAIIKSRLLPFLGGNFFTTGGAMTADASLSVLAEAAGKNRELDELQDMYEKSLQDLEGDLDDKKAELQDVKDELLDAKNEINRSMRSSQSDKMFLETEVQELRRKLAIAEDEVRTLRSKAGLLTDYETQVRRLRDDIALLTSRRDSLYRSSSSMSLPLKDDSYVSSHSQLKDDPPKKRDSFKDNKSGDIYGSLSSYRYTPRIGSPCSPDDPVLRVRQQNLVSRWNDMYNQDRLDAMDTLRRFSDDHENNQRIIFLAVQESHSVAKLAFRQFKMKVRANLAATHIGPETLEEAVQDYINRNTDLYDLPGMVSDVIRGLNRSPKIFLPPDCSFAIVQPFIRESCKLAWQMNALAIPMDIAVATDAELFDNNKYRRTYDSEYTAPLVNHHVWAALMQGAKVVMKGEATTRRGASLGMSRRSRSPTRSRSISPSPRPRSRSRSLSPTRRSRSPSPRRSTYSSDPVY